MGALGSASALTLAPAAVAVGPGPAHPAAATPRHVLLLSVDGMHQSDLAMYAAAHPTSALASLTRGGVSYDHASTPVPSDSFPGMVGQVTGGNPRTTGVYYDVSYHHALLPAGPTSCAGVTPGASVAYDESLDKDLTRLDAGQGLAGLPGSILSLTGHPASLINKAALPVDPLTCQPVMPHSYLQVNTIFDVVHRAGLRTAWSDKHPAYEILGGPSGQGIDDLFTWKSVSPRVGFSWKLTPDAKTVLKSHYGRYYRGIVTGEFHDASPTVAPKFFFLGTVWVAMAA